MSLDIYIFGGLGALALGVIIYAGIQSHRTLKARLNHILTNANAIIERKK